MGEIKRKNEDAVERNGVRSQERGWGHGGLSERE